MAPLNNQDGTLWNNACGSPTYFNKEVFMPKAAIHFKKRVLEKNNSLDFLHLATFLVGIYLFRTNNGNTRTMQIIVQR